MKCVWLIIVLIVLSILILASSRLGVAGWTKKREKMHYLFTNIYYINLDKRPEKQKNIDSQLTSKRLKNLTRNPIRFRAIDGNQLSVIDPQTINLKGIEDLNNPVKKFGLTLTKGAIGCAMSHKTIWEQVVKTKETLVLILEDDAVILPNFTRKISAIIAELPAEWDILYLGGSQYTTEKRISLHLAQPSRIYGLFGYVINWRGAKRLLQHCFPLRYQLDTELWMNFKNLKPLMAMPLVIGEKKRESDIQIKVPLGAL